MSDDTSISGSRKRSILVLGAGELGMAVLRPLSERARSTGVEVAALLRQTTIDTSDPAKRSNVDELNDRGVELVAGDIAALSVEELADVFARYDEVVSCVGFAAGPGTQLRLAKAALDAKLKRYFPWQFGVDYDRLGRGSAQDLFDEQLDVRDLLRGQDRVAWVIVSVGMFTSFLFEPAFGVVDFEQSKVNALGSWANQVTLTTPEDIGRLLTEIILSDPMIKNEIIFLAGDTVSYEQIAEIAERVSGLKIARFLSTVPILEEQLAEKPADPIRKYRVVFAKGPGMAWDKSISFNHRQGITTTSAREWAETNQSRLLGRTQRVS